MSESRTWLWVGLGCGIALVGMCLVTGIALAVLVHRSRPSTDVPGVAHPPPMPPPPTPPGPPPAPPVSGGATPLRRVLATVAEVEGLEGIPTGGTCDLDLSRHDLPTGGFWCRAVIRCENQTLYGDGDTGYFHCALYGEPGDAQPVIGDDRGTTVEDRDAAMSLNTRDGVLVLRDDATGARGAFRLRATFESSQ